MERIALSIPPSLLERVDAEAERRGVSRSALIRFAMQAYLEEPGQVAHVGRGQTVSSLGTKRAEKVLAKVMEAKQAHKHSWVAGSSGLLKCSACGAVGGRR